MIEEPLISLELDHPIWERFYMVFPLVVIGSKESQGYDLAPKHMAMPMGWDNYFGFVCTPAHGTYQNIKREGTFTVSFPPPDHVLMASLAASPRCDKPDNKPILKNLETVPADVVDGVFLKNSYLCLECNLERIIDGFGKNSLITGEIVGAKIQEKVLRDADQDDQSLLYNAPLLAYLYPGRFAEIKETFSFPFPANFRK